MTDWTATFQPEWRVSLLPGNATAWETVLEIIDADLAARDPTGLIPAARGVETTPPSLLAYLAEERSVDEFDSGWALSRQRAVVAGSFAFHQRKGTRPSLDDALVPLGYTVEVVEWFEADPVHDPYTFQVRVVLGLDEPWLVANRAQLVRLANGAKNAHTKLEAIAPERVTHPARIYVGGMPSKNRTLIVCEVAEIADLPTFSFVWTGAVSQRLRTLIVQPRP